MLAIDRPQPVAIRVGACDERGGSESATAAISRADENAAFDRAADDAVTEARATIRAAQEQAAKPMVAENQRLAAEIRPRIADLLPLLRQLQHVNSCADRSFNGGRDFTGGTTPGIRNFGEMMADPRVDLLYDLETYARQIGIDV